MELAAGTIYHYRAKGVLRNKTTYGYDKTFVTDDKPTSVTNLATAVTSEAATLNGSVNPNGDDATVAFEYGLDTNYGNLVAGGLNTLSGSTSQPFNSDISGLLPGATYHYRVTAVNSVRSNAGNDMTFTTLALPPEIITVDATDVTSTGALLWATVDTNGAASTVKFEIGIASGTYIMIMPVSGISVSNSLLSQDVSYTIASLVSETTYYYRATVDNGTGGQVDSIVEKSFTTLAAEE